MAYFQHLKRLTQELEDESLLQLVNLTIDFTMPSPSSGLLVWGNRAAL